MTARSSARLSQSARVKINQARANALAGQFVGLCLRVGLPEPKREWAFALDFAEPRRWRFDFAWPTQRVALESEGGVWSKGAHTRGGHFLSDMEKYNTAALDGWRVFRTVPGQLLEYSTLRMLGTALGHPLPPLGSL